MKSTAKFSSLLLWLVVHRQGQAQPGCEDPRWDCSLCWRGMLVEGVLVDRSCTGAGGAEGFEVTGRKALIKLSQGVKARFLFTEEQF